MQSGFSHHSPSGCCGDGVLSGGSERQSVQDFAGNVSKLAAEVHQADGVHSPKGVQENLQRYLRQHGRDQCGE